MSNVLEFQKVNAGYDRIPILHELSFSVGEGQVFGVIGPNGSGKTTMFNALLGLIKTKSGKILFQGTNIAGASPDARCRMGIGRTFQIPRPFEKLSVYENVLVAEMYGAGRSERTGREKALELLKRTDLYDMRELPAGTLTLLDRKRLEVARALGTEPKLLLLDEIAAGLIDMEVREIMKLVAMLKQSGYTIIWIEHILEAMLESTDWLMCMSEGQNIIEGKPQEVIASKEVETLYLGVTEHAGSNSQN